MHEYLKFKKIDFQVSLMYAAVILLITGIGSFFFDMEHNKHTRNDDMESQIVEKRESTIKTEENEIIELQESSVNNDQDICPFYFY